MPSVSKSTLSKRQIIDAALRDAAANGYQNVTRERVAQMSGYAPATVSLYYGTMTKLKRAIMRAAVTNGNLAVLAQGLAMRDKDAMCAPEELKSAARATIGK